VLHQGLGVWERNVHLCEYLATEVLGTVHRFLLTLNPSPKDNIGSGFLFGNIFWFISANGHRETKPV
jgi:hypothetical protein